MNKLLEEQCFIQRLKMLVYKSIYLRDDFHFYYQPVFSNTDLTMKEQFSI